MTQPLPRPVLIGLLAPMVVIVIGYVAARIAHDILDASIAWLPTMIVYWASLALVILTLRGIGVYRTWLQPSQGKVIWRWLSLLNPLFVMIPTLLFGKSVAAPSPWIFVAWLLIVLLNPIVEEGFWRGTLMDATRDWPGWASVLNSAFWFGLSHPLVIGVNIALVAGVTGFIGIFLGLIQF